LPILLYCYEETADTDGDGFPDVVEKDAGSDPNDKNSTPDNLDTDKDGFPDKVEKAEGTDPNDPKSVTYTQHRAHETLTHLVGPEERKE
ncbi:hypothetical protein, partial [Streptococcus pseudopneumoniae]|uniref:hypothetical protein n=1 Tax=Streptococcus pseudopneumoniae TaxID=257758 RepID=UPI0019D5FA03